MCQNQISKWFFNKPIKPILFRFYKAIHCRWRCNILKSSRGQRYQNKFARKNKKKCFSYVNLILINQFIIEWSNIFKYFYGRLPLKSRLSIQIDIGQGQIMHVIFLSYAFKIIFKIHFITSQNYKFFNLNYFICWYFVSINKYWKKC